MDPYLLVAVAEGWNEATVQPLLDPDAQPERLLTDCGKLPAAARRRLAAADLRTRAEGIVTQCRERGITIVTAADPRFPARLSETPDCPRALFVQGDPDRLGDALALSVVGSRTPTPYGQQAATAFCQALAAAGFRLWSGLARGIDAIAHERCVAAEVPTVAVRAGGFDHIYPPEHSQLAGRIVASGGCLVSELPPDRRARRGHFPRRNRILAGATDATLVVEAGSTSGSLITARLAAELGRDVHCVPGPWSSSRSQGCHDLIQQGAMLASGPADLLRSLGVSAALPPATAPQLARDADQRTILTLLEQGPRPTDLLLRESGLVRAAFLQARMQLERAGTIQTLAGGLLTLSR